MAGERLLAQLRGPNPTFLGIEREAELGTEERQAGIARGQGWRTGGYTLHRTARAEGKPTLYSPVPGVDKPGQGAGLLTAGAGLCGEMGGNHGSLLMPASARCPHGEGSLPPAPCERRHGRGGGGSRGVPPPIPPTATPAAAAGKAERLGEQKAAAAAAAGGRRGEDSGRREVPRFTRGRPGSAGPSRRSAPLSPL